MPNQMILMNGKKLMWDGVDYPDQDKTSAAINQYKVDGFEVETCEEDGKTFLYTRRVVKHIAVPGA
jgi:hypothetical protein